MRINPSKCEVSTNGPKITANMEDIHRVTKDEPYKYLGIDFNKYSIDDSEIIFRIIQVVKDKLEKIKKNY